MVERSSERRVFSVQRSEYTDTETDTQLTAVVTEDYFHTPQLRCTVLPGSTVESYTSHIIMLHSIIACSTTVVPLYVYAQRGHSLKHTGYSRRLPLR